MKLQPLLLIAVFAAFGALSLAAIAEHGYFGLFEHQFQSLADLVVACLLITVWMIGDARRSGRTVWPYLALTLAAGSFGPLLYLLVGQFGSRKAQHALA